MLRALRRQAVDIIEEDGAAEVQRGCVVLASGRKLECDECIWATGGGWWE